MIPLGPFELHYIVASGGMADVWAGVHRAQKVPVAVKVLRSGGAWDAIDLAALRNEIRAAARLRHPAIVTLHDHGSIDDAAAAASDGLLVGGSPFLVMELVSGGTLNTIRPTLDWGRLRAILLTLLDALAHAHARGVVHRDIKPSNVLVSGEDGRIKLSDFGISRALDIEDDSGGPAPEAAEDLVGSPPYMAPEQFVGSWRDLGPWTDLYSVGCLAWTLACGRPPFLGRSIEELAELHNEAAVPAFAPTITVPPGLEDWLLRLLVKLPLGRFRWAADAAVELAGLGAADDATVDAHRPGAESTVVIPLDLMRASALELDSVDGPLPSVTPTSSIVPAHWAARPVSAPAPPLRGVGLSLRGLRPAPFVGRVAERDVLWETLRRVAEDQRAEAVLIRGGVGTGKTRLARWLVERAQEVGAGIGLHVHHAPETGPGDGLGPMLAGALRATGLGGTDLLSRVETALGAIGLRDPAQWQAAAEVILPATDEELRAGLRTVRFTSGAERLACLRTVLEATAEDQPVIVWVDDVPWGREAVSFCRQVLDAQASRPIPVLFLLTARDDALEAAPDVAAVLADLVEASHLGAMSLGPLHPEECAELVRDRLGLEGELSDRIQRRSGGNPSFALELVDGLFGAERLVATPDGYRLRDGERIELPVDIESAWSDRIDRLLAGRSPWDELALELAALLGAEVRRDEWDAVCAEDGFPASVELVESLLAQGLARTGVDGLEVGWSFAHQILRESLEQRASNAGRWERHHRICARVLARASGSPETSARIGRHLLAAGRPERAATHFEEAARHAVYTGRFGRAEDALVRFESALAAADIDPNDPRWGTGWLLRGRLAEARGQLVEADRLAARAERSRPGWESHRAWALNLRARVARHRGRRDLFARCVGSAERLSEALGDRRLRGDCRFLQAIASGRSGDHDAAELLYLAAHADFTEVGYRVGAASCIQARAYLQVQRGRRAEAEALHRQSIPLFEELGARLKVAHAKQGLGDLARLGGDLEGARGLYIEARDACRAVGSVQEAVCELNLALVLVEEGNDDAAEVVLTRLKLELERAGRRQFLGAVCVADMAAQAGLGDWSRWDAASEAAEKLLQEAPMVELDIARMARLAGDRAAAAGSTHRARRAWRLALAQFEALGRQDESELLRGCLK